MAQASDPHITPVPQAQDTASAPLEWEEPKLTFLEPTLTTHGRLTELTAGFAGVLRRR